MTEQPRHALINPPDLREKSVIFLDSQFVNQRFENDLLEVDGLKKIQINFFAKVLFFQSTSSSCHAKD